MTNSIKFPLWFTVLTAAYFLSNLFVFGLAGLLNPSIPFPDMGHTEAAFPIQFFSIRHIAFAFPLLYGLVKKDVRVLRALYGVFLVMAVLDVSLLILNGYYVPVIGDLPLPVKISFGLGAFFAPVSLALLHLNSYQVTVTTTRKGES